MLDEFTMRPLSAVIPGERVLIALSGGADSVALAVLLAEAREAYGLELFAAHVDHGIRPESAEDAEYCRELCERLGIPFYCARVDAPGEAKKRREGLETAARRLRYEQLRRFKSEAGADCVALAHHMDDQAETVLMHLARGAGPEGIGGMRARSGDLWRPLLGLRKAELTALLQQRGFGWREDATNLVADNPRNALRLHGIPELEKCYPQFVRAAARYARSAQIESDCLEALTREYLARCGKIEGFCAWLELEDMPHPALLRRAIRTRCPEELDWEQVNALEALCHEARGKLDLGKDHFAERAGHRLYFVPKALPEIPPAPLSLDSKTSLGDLGQITASPWNGGPVRNDPLTQALDPTALEGAVLRTRREGDRIRPLGGGNKLLSDYFIDKKVDRPLRDAVPLVAVGNRVHWVVGHGISREAALKGGGQVLLRFEYKK